MNVLEALTDYWFVIQGYLPKFLVACLVAIEITVVGVLVSWAFGVVAALGKLSKVKLIQIPARFYVWSIRGTPRLLQIFLWYFGLPQLGIRVSPFVAGVMGLGVNIGAYVAEIIRAGLLAIPKGQYESAQALGMGYVLYMRRIILPQLAKITIPPITNTVITFLMCTSLLSSITVMELTYSVQLAVARTFRPFEFYIVAAILYLLMVSVLSGLSGKIEKRLALPYERTP